MKQYIFYSTDGFTFDKNFDEIENCQILGWATGSCHNDALKNLRQEMRLDGFDTISCQELRNNTTILLE